MGIKISVNSVPTTRISINTPNMSRIRSVGIPPNQNVNKLASLTDVDASNPVDGATLVYDEASEKYVVEILPIVDGGEF